METIKLSNGLEMPVLGLGANGLWGCEPALTEKQYNIYRYVLTNKKCRLFDTSGAYGDNEAVLGEAIRNAGRGIREEILLMSKVSCKDQIKRNIRSGLENTLKALGTDYLDIYLLHWPRTGVFTEAYLEMEKLYEEGLIRAIGVCNCHIHHIEELMWNAHILPMINQFEVHPLFTQDALVNYCYAYDIQVIAYTPLARMHDVLIKSRPVCTLAERYGKTPVQIILRWHQQQKRIPIPRTTNIRHFEEFLMLEDFVLTDKEMAWINSLNQNIRLRFNPDYCDFSKL